MNTRKLTILLIESNQASLELYQRELSAVFNVLAFPDETGVLEAITSKQVQVVIIEPEIRSGHGWKLIDQINALTLEYRPKIIICSLQDVRRKGLETGADVYLVKPILPKDLSNKVLAVLKMNKAKRKPLP
jgi:DNA-binding response OmpR family regulator